MPRVPPIVTGKNMEGGTKSVSIGCNTGFGADIEAKGRKPYGGTVMLDKGTGTQTKGGEGQEKQGEENGDKGKKQGQIKTTVATMTDSGSHEGGQGDEKKVRIHNTRSSHIWGSQNH